MSQHIVTNLGEWGGFCKGSMNVKTMHTEWDKVKPAEDKGNEIRKNSVGMQKSFTLISGKQITLGGFSRYNSYVSFLRIFADRVL